MKKAEWNSLVKRNLAGGDAPDDIQGQYHPRVIDAYLDLAFGSLITDQQDKFGRIKDWKLDSITKPFCEDVKCDAKTGLFYVKVPVETFTLRENAQIRQISPVKGVSLSFVPRNGNGNWVYDTLDVRRFTNDIAYWLEHDRIYFSNFDTQLKQVILRLAIRFREFEDDDEIKFPNDSEGEVFSLVWIWMRRIGPEDVVSDSNQTK